MGRVGSLVVAICLLPTYVYAQSSRTSAASPSDLCQRAIAGNPSMAHLPPNLLTAIGRVESGRVDPHDGTLKAWPWSVNAEGRGYVFNTKAEAIVAVQALQARKVMSVDVGCMQVNLMYHPTAFGSLDEAFDPAVNVRYASKFLGELYAETRDWNLAAAFYHSKTPDLALSYQQKVLAQMPGAARVQAASMEQVSLTNAWSATLGAPQPSAAAPVFAAQGKTWAPQPARSHLVLLASRR